MNTSKLVRYSEYNRDVFKNQIKLLDEDDQEHLKVYMIERLSDDEDAMKLYGINSTMSIIYLHGILINRAHTNLVKAKAQQYVMILQGIFRFMEELLSRGAYGAMVKGLADIQMKFMDLHRVAIMKMAEKAVATGDQGQLYSGIFRILDQLDPRTRIIVSVIGVAIIYIGVMTLCGPEIAMEAVNAFAQYMGCNTDKSEACPSVRSLGAKVVGSAMGWFLNSSDDNSDSEDEIPSPKAIRKSKPVKKIKDTKPVKKTVSKSKNKKKTLDMDGFPEISTKKSKNKKKTLDMDGFPEMPSFD